MRLFESMRVTINTDASYSPDHNIAAYAYWIKSDQGKICKADLFRNTVLTPNEAEFKAIVNSLHELCHTEWTPINYLHINSDSQNCIDILMGHSIPRQENMQRLTELSLQYLKRLEERREHKNGKFLVCKHVKAHKGITDKRTYVNNWCDVESRKILREAVKKRNYMAQ